MKIKKSELIELIREVITEESEYRAYFKKVAAEKEINPDEIDKLSDEEKKKFFNAVDKGWKAQNEAYMHDCDVVHPEQSHKEWKKMEETLEFQQFSKGHPGDRIKARKRQQILKKPEVQENKKASKKLKLTTESIRKMIREELIFLMYNEVPPEKSRKRGKRNSSLLGNANAP